jgi:membrane-associated protease RseP (regulator of RpoE activity)
MIGVLILLVILLVTVCGHELAHLLVARALGVDAHEYSFGMGPLLAKTNRFGLQWSIRAFPIGGFVRLVGEDGTPGPRSFDSARAWRQVVIIVVGPLSNILMGLVVFWAVFVARGMDPIRSVAAAFMLAGWLLGATGAAIAGWFSSGAGIATMPLAGIPGLVAASGSAAAAPDAGTMVLILAGVLAITMGVMNALPLPPLDGGVAMLAALRGLLGRKRYPAAAMRKAGLVTLGLLIVFIAAVNGIDLAHQLGAFR